MIFTDRQTGLHIADSNENPLDIELPPFSVLSGSVETMIISASGWRRVFAPSGDEEDASSNIDSTGVALAAAAAMAMADWAQSEGATIVVATDSRPTGGAIADVMIRILRLRGVFVRYLFIASTPEVLAYTKLDPRIAGFAYVSASHNPIGHNGFKFGGADGSVFGGTDAVSLADTFYRYVSEDGYQMMCEEISQGSTNPGEAVDDVYQEVPRWKRESLQSYREFSRIVLAGNGNDGEGVIARLRQACKSRGFGVVAELNGSARGASIDRDFFSELGVVSRFINDKPGEISHRIVPEGESLDLCRFELEESYAGNKRFQIGYVPDNDGDRGNLVYIGTEGSALELHAQALFALACVAEFSYLESVGSLQSGRRAVVVNGPTSLRIERIAELFGIEVVRTEVGEAHVVNRAQELRLEGVEVRILGEGSNGGTIIHPSTVRDPLSTLGSLLKLLMLPGIGSNPSPLEIWCNRVGARKEKMRSVADLLSSIPAFTTTGAYESRAILKLEIPDHGALKRAYEEMLPEVWRDHGESLKERFDFHSYRVVNYEGLYELPGAGNRDRSGGERGGLKVIFSDAQAIDLGFIWMRGSGTEPVFRVLADLEGNNLAGEAELLDFQKMIIIAARQRAFD